MTTRLELSLACGERLEVHEISVEECLSSLFTVKVTARSQDPSIDLRPVVGAPAAVRLVAARRSGRFAERRWTGICSRARAVQAVEVGEGEAGLSTYELTITPTLWLLRQRSGHRIFQHLAIPEVARALLDEWGITSRWQVAVEDHPRQPYKVQHAETDLDFVNRLLEEAGITYRFSDEDEREASSLVLADAMHATGPRRETPIRFIESPTDTLDEDWVTRVSVDEEVRVALVVVRDHDFERPMWRLRGEARAATDEQPARERYVYRPGAFLVEHGGGREPRVSHADSHGAALAGRALEAARSGRRTLGFETNVADLRPGTIFFLEGHPWPELNGGSGWLVTSLRLEGTPHGVASIRGTAVPAGEPYRPAQRTPKPRVHGVQSAVVVGPPGEEIHTDAHGRVKVQFPWDRDGKGDDDSSCWLRVSQGWAGAGLGLFALPRVGQEVLVAFLAGDPDQPIIVGRVSNPLNPPPLRLPEEKTQSVWRSASTPGGGGYNEIRFEDREGAERVTVHAQRDLHARVESSAISYVGRDAHLTIEGQRRERIGGKQSLTVEADQHQVVAGVAAMEAGVIHLWAAGAVVIEGADLTLRGAGGFIRIDGAGVTIDGGPVRIQEGGSPGAAPAAAPDLPLLPGRADAARPRPPVRLPLFELPGVPRGQWPGRGDPLTPDDRFLCSIMCWCLDTPFPQSCVARKLREMDRRTGGGSRYKAEVPYDMSKVPPEPIMSRNETWRPSGGRWKGSRIPDVVVVKDPSRPPTQDNIEEVVEMKFGRDTLDEDQMDAYARIAGKARFRVLSPEDCDCPKPEERPKPAPVPEPDASADLAEALLLTLAVIALVLDDAAPGGQVDDVLLPPTLARLGETLGRLLPRLNELLKAPIPGAAPALP